MSNTVVDLIRHGEPLGGRAIRGNGIDDSLSDLGWQQMRSAVADYSKWNLIVSSPLVRCSDFSREISDKLKIPIMIEDNLKEVGFGNWEGRTQDEIKNTNLDEYQQFYLDPVNNRPVGAEPLLEFFTRVVEVYEKIIKTHKGERILIVTHAGVIRAIITHILKAELSSMYRIKVFNAGITRIVHTKDNSILERHGVNLKAFV
ncbi:MAG: histidine phosphatase family protein [Gammaproteobacteria bacterium]